MFDWRVRGIDEVLVAVLDLVVQEQFAEAVEMVKTALPVAKALDTRLAARDIGLNVALAETLLRLGRTSDGMEHYFGIIDDLIDGTQGNVLDMPINDDFLKILEPGQLATHYPADADAEILDMHRAVLLLAATGDYVTAEAVLSDSIRLTKGTYGTNSHKFIMAMQIGAQLADLQNEPALSANRLQRYLEVMLKHTDNNTNLTKETQIVDEHVAEIQMRIGQRLAQAGDLPEAIAALQEARNYRWDQRIETRITG